jgi:hypothetical protein
MMGEGGRRSFDASKMGRGNEGERRTRREHVSSGSPDRGVCCEPVRDWAWCDSSEKE